MNSPESFESKRRKPSELQGEILKSIGTDAEELSKILANPEKYVGRTPSAQEYVDFLRKVFKDTEQDLPEK